MHAKVDLLFVGNVLNTKKMKIDNKTVHKVPLLIKTSCEAGRKSELKIERLHTLTKYIELLTYFMQR